MKQLTQPQRARAKKMIKNTAVILAVGLLYAVFIKITGWALPCFFWKLTGKVCPGCGVTRMCMALLRFDFKAAAGHNLLLMVLSPFLIAYGIYRARAYVLHGGSTFQKWEGAAVGIAMVLTLAFWILRNMEAYSFLMP